MKIADLRNNLSDALNRVTSTGERIVIERRGKGVAALVSMEDLALLERIEDEADIKAARKALKEKGEVPIEEIKKRLGMKADIKAARKSHNEKGGITLAEYRKKHRI